MQSNLQASVKSASEGLAQDLYVAARVGFELTTFLMQGTEHNTEPPHHELITLKSKLLY